MIVPIFCKGKSAPNITPPGPRHGLGNTSGLSHTIQKSTAADVMEGVETDYSVHVRVADRDKFMRKLFPVEDRIMDAVLAHSDVEKLYVVPGNGGKDRWKAGNGRWEGFPPQSENKLEAILNKLEAILYSAFVKVANTIRTVTQGIIAGDKANDVLESNEWVDYHSKSPKSNNPEAPAIRPDCLLALTHIQKHADTLESKSERLESNAGGGGMKDVSRLAIWWLQIIAAVEVKRADHKTWEDTVKQLIGYLRQILREQLDRRFVFGFTLGPSQISVWVHDRSGVLGMDSPVDIHKEPMAFVRLIAALVCLSPDKLGFDPTMRLYISPEKIAPSYRLDRISLATYQATGPYDLRWIIQMNDGTTYLTVRVLSIARGSVMRGRGTVVWAVTPFTAGSASESRGQEALVLKQSWRPVDAVDELTLYKSAKAGECGYVGKISKCEDVMIRGRSDETKSLIRQGLSAATPASVQSTKSESKKRVRNEEEEPYFQVKLTDKHEISSFSTTLREPISRVHTRVLLDTFGWPIKYFSIRGELVRALVDAIKGHRHLYERGVLHRDISVGNVLITWTRERERTSSGCLIDLDRAKQGKTVEDTDIQRPLQRENLISRVKDMCAMYLEDELGDSSTVSKLPDIDDAVVLLARNILSPVKQPVRSISDYIVAALLHISRFESYTGSMCTPEMLHWPRGNMQKPSFSFKFLPSELSTASKTGTPPYTSGEILSNKHYFPPMDDVHHDAIHDVESFFWVFVHICLTRQGPGGERREELSVDVGAELNGEYKTQCEHIQLMVWCFFDGDDVVLERNKFEAFAQPDEFEKLVVGSFHPYFDSLKGIAREWWSLLQLAYKYRAFECLDIHSRVIDILEKALKMLGKSLDELDDASQRVLDRREKDVNTIGGQSLFTRTSPKVVHTGASTDFKPISMEPPESPTPQGLKKPKLMIGKV